MKQTTEGRDDRSTMFDKGNKQEGKGGWEDDRRRSEKQEDRGQHVGQYTDFKFQGQNQHRK